MSSTSRKSARRYVIRGRVQGVGFRDFTQCRATELGLTGYVRNLADGNVEAVAQGGSAQLDEFAGLLRQGPRGSNVRGVEQAEHPLLQSDGFVIKH